MRKPPQPRRGEQGTTEYRPPPAFCAFYYLCRREYCAGCVLWRHTMRYLTCRFGSRAWKVLSPPWHHGPLCWVHHNNCGRDEVVLQACIHDTKHNQYLKREREYSTSWPRCRLLRVPSFGAPRHRHLFPCVVLPGPCLRASCSGLPNPAWLRHMRLARPICIASPFVIPHQNEATRCLVASAEPISVHLIYCWCVRLQAVQCLPLRKMRPSESKLLVLALRGTA